MKAKARPFADFTVNPDRAAHPLDQTLGYGQPQPGPFKLAVGLAFDLIELAKDMIQMFGRDADSGVLDRDMQLLVPRLGL